MLRVSKIITIALAMVAVACTMKTDPELENRLARLEQRCDQLNQELSALSALVNAMGSGDWVTDVTPVTEDGVVTGYMVNFYVHGPILITCGKDGADGKNGLDGKDGKTPALGVTTLEDGNLYWTLNGEVLKDAAGKPVAAEGVTPQMKVEEGKWYVSYDGGKTWTYAGPATTVPEGQVVFKDVTVDTQTGNVTFTLSDGSTFAASLKPSVEIVLDTEGLETSIVGGETITIGYTLIGADENTVVTAASDGNYKVTVKSEGTKGGKILVTAPRDYTDGFVNVILSNGRGYTYVKVVNFYERKGSVSGGGRDYEYAVPTAGGTFEIPVSVNFPYTVKTSTSWIEFLGTRAPVHTDNLQFNVQKNESNSARTGKAYIYPDNNPTKAFLTITFNQASAYFSIDKTQFIMEAEGGTYTTAIHTSKDFTVSIPAEASWLTSSITSSATGEYTLTITVAENSGTARRQADVKLVGAGNITLATLFVAQYASNEDERDAMIITVWVNFANDFTVGLPIHKSNDKDIIDVMIDWGDGVVEHCISSDPTHTYEGLDKGRSFDVKVTGKLTRLYGQRVTRREAIIAVKQWGRLGLKYLDSAFSGYEGLVSIPGDTDFSFSEVESFSSAFSYCTGLTSLPENLFSSCSKATKFDYAFRGCRGLTGIPDYLFANCTSATSFKYVFEDCEELSSIPAHLFAHCSLATDFENAFSGCRGVSSIPETLFGDCVSATSFDGTFLGCYNITSIPGNLFAICVSALGFSRTFSNCKGLTSIPETLFASCPSVTEFYCTFKDCIGLTSIPENLFAACSLATSFVGTFQGCSGLKTIPEALFSHCDNALDFGTRSYYNYGMNAYGTFTDCSGLLSIPENLFSACKEVRCFRGVFYGCSSLTSIPSGLFSQNRKVNDFDDAFNGCYSLTGESPFSVINGKRIHLYERADYPDYFHAPTDFDECFAGCPKLTDYASIPSGWK